LTKTLSHNWNTMSDKSKILMHSFVDSTFKTSLKVFSKAYKAFYTV
jgi:hypothetical protein